MQIWVDSQRYRMSDQALLGCLRLRKTTVLPNCSIQATILVVEALRRLHQFREGTAARPARRHLRMILSTMAAEPEARSCHTLRHDWEAAAAGLYSVLRT